MTCQQRNKGNVSTEKYAAITFLLSEEIPEEKPR
jgi:hypothetical protein